jgi:cysteinyl-tRNA synthetase
MNHNIKIYNTLSEKKEPIKPIKGKKINLFVCGPTVYDYSHIGHARNYITFDSFVKYLRHCGYDVFYLQNITDIDDKIIARAREKQVLPKDLAEAFGKEYLKDMKKIGVTSVSKYAKATSYIKEIISQVKRLLEKGYAYQIQDDGVYFDISKFKEYGKLSGRTILQAEDAVSRVDYSKDKRNRGDFCLWKLKQESSEPSWKSPFGEGRPGWHIEDTAITEKYFGFQYDIHGAARDLIFPHHEAEIAQMEAISGKKPMAKYWMHVGFLTVNGQKMSKSLNNFITITDILNRQVSAENLRFLILKNLWNSPVDYCESVLMEVKSATERIEEFLKKIKDIKIKKSQIKGKNSKAIKDLKLNFYKELDDNFNTPRAFAVIFDFIKTINQSLEEGIISKKEAEDIYGFFEEINKFLGIINFQNIKIVKSVPEKIKALANQREEFRKNQEWQKADLVRIEIEKSGYTIKDTKDGHVVKKL